MPGIPMPPSLWPGVTPSSYVPETPPAVIDEVEVALNEDGLPVKRKKRKAYSENCNDSVSTIFRCPNPHIISTAEVEEFLKHHEHLKVREPFLLANPKTYIGIEVEVENVLRIDPNIGLFFWTIKPDNSLRNRGQEFVTKGVIPASAAEPALMQLLDGLNHNVDFSNRTSVHIHEDVRQLTLTQLLGLLLTYTAVENLLFKYAGLTRRNNIFCVPITETGLFDNLNTDPTKVLHSIDQHWSKYTAFNLLPVVNQGSVEFRHLPGTKNIRQILGWIDLIGRLKTHAYKYDLGSIISQISDLNSSSRYRQFVDTVFNEASILLDTSNLLADMERPVYIVKNAAISNKFHEYVVKNVNQDSQLAALFNSWAKSLSKQQYDTLVELCKGWGNSNVEQVFRHMVTNPTLYYKQYPDKKEQIDVVLKAKALNRAVSKQAQINQIYGF